MTVVVLGPAVLDRFYRLPRLPRTGESVLVETTWLDAGGKGLNQAVAAARAGAPARLACALAGDRAGRFLRRVAVREGVATDELLPARGGRSDETVIWVDRAGRHVLASRLAPGAWLPPELPRRVERMLAAGDRLLVAGPVPPALLVPLAARLAGRGVHVHLNLAPFPYDYGDLWPHLALVVANEGEMRLHLGRPPGAAARALLARGVRAVVTTRGAGGAVWIDPERRLRVPAPPVPVVDTTAAGDVLAGVLAARLAAGAPPERALRVAVRAASATVGRLGARGAIPRASEIARWCREEETAGRPRRP